MRLKIEQPPTIFLWIGTNNSAMLITTDFPKKKHVYTCNETKGWCHLPVRTRSNTWDLRFKYPAIWRLAGQKKISSSNCRENWTYRRHSCQRQFVPTNQHLAVIVALRWNPDRWIEKDKKTWWTLCTSKCRFGTSKSLGDSPKIWLFRKYVLFSMAKSGGVNPPVSDLCNHSWPDRTPWKAEAWAWHPARAKTG